MIVEHARDLARRWVVEEAQGMPGFAGAYFAGSTLDLPGAAVQPATSDLDVMVVLDDSDPPVKPGKVIYRDVVLDVSYLPRDLLRSPELVLGHYHLAGSFAAPSVILDPSGWLTELQVAVAEDFAERRWVSKRCEHARNNVLAFARSSSEADPFPDQVTAWLFAAGVTTHVLLVAGLKNPTVRRRYVAAQELLADSGHLDFYESLLELLGCAHMRRARAEDHLAALANAFDAAKAAVGTPFFFASDISDVARPIAIDGSRELIAGGDHRDAVFWMVATNARCQKVLALDAPAPLKDRFTHGFRHLLADLGVTSFADLRRRSEQVEAFLPRVWEVSEAIMAANRGVEDGRRAG